MSLMHRVHLKMLIVAIMASLTVVSCYVVFDGLVSARRSHDWSTTIQQPPEDSSYPVTIRLEPSKSSYALGEIVEIRVFLVNKGSDTLKIGPMNYGYTVFDSGGKPLVCLHVRSLWGSETPYALPSFGEAFLANVVWGQRLPRKLGPILISENVAPGSYLIQIYTSGAVQVTAEVNVPIEGNFGDYILSLMKDWFQSTMRWFENQK